MKLLTALKYMYKSFVQNDEYSRFVLSEKLVKIIYPGYKFSEYGRSFLKDKKFAEFYEKYEGENVHSYDRKYLLSQLVKLTDHLDGDVAECGVFEGASSYLMFERIEHKQKKMHLFDSFEGLSAPNDTDGGYWAEGDLSASERTVRENLPDSGKILYYKGWIPEKFYLVDNVKFSFVHLDVDLYQPTYDSLAFFYARMEAGGIIVCDDYGFDSCPGAKKALDEFFLDKEEIIKVPTGQAFVIKR
ncbi:MAG: methyltransferase [Piscirickettsiaceae bacterium]|jgi:O-methyltransferase|nr:methyltransferase [Piscirickettsiaceae bacterium]